MPSDGYVAMALEITGLVVGTAALVGTFKDCVDVFGMIVAARSVTDDADILNTKLDIERMLLLQWADRTGLTEPEHYDRRLDDPELSQTVAGALESIKRLLSDGKVLKDRYGLADYQEAQHGIVLGDKLEIKASSTRLQQFLQRFDKLSLRTNMPQREYSIGTRFRWVVKDKEKFASLMEHLSYFVSRLNTLVPAEGQSVGTMTKEDLAQIRSVPQLKLIIRASTRLQPQIAIIAEQAIRSLNQQRVLDRLWFRWIDDRKTTIKDRHFRTLDWALEPPEHVLEWDNLAEWLRDESGLYWLAGKAGSGKSTLMKYLSDHPQANTLLKKWAAQSELVTLQFFFYALGRSEQKSQDGVLRSLLFQFLDKHREVIEEVLPAMWKQAVITEDEIKELEMPSIAEMQASLLQLAGIVSADKRFWILIDGLDEFEGKHSTIAAFISKLAQLPNVKLVVSSRPLPVFVNAFEQAPKMHLQDLTSADIEAYIDDMILNHHHIAQLSRIEPGMAVKIAETLIDKASGVFLWVVLACESILEGLEDYDTVPELMDRVNELPPELGDFFRQIIARLDPRKRDQNARIIRLVFEGQTSLAPIPTVGLDIVDEQGLRTDFSGPNAKIVRNEELVKRCERLEGRLRSRCSGLVEIQTDCAVRLVGNSESLTADGVALVNSRVVFMHRSLYEFLCTEGIWEWDVLSVDSRCGPFESHVILASLWAQLAGLRPWGDIQYKGVCFDNALVHNIRAAATSCPPSLLTTNFSRLQDLFTGDERYSPMWYCAELWLPHQPKCRRSYEDLSAGLALAAEFAMISLVQLALEDPDELRRRLIPPEEGQLMGCCDFVICPTKLYESNMCQPESKSRSRSTVFPLLYHATCRPFLPLFQRMGQSTFKASQEGVDSTELVRYLLSKGNDPNEEFYYNESLSMNEKFSVYEKRSMNEVGVITTPWIRWLSFIGREGLLYSPNDESDPTDLDLDSDVELVHQRGAITMLFVDAGAVVGAPETDMCHLVDNSLSHVILNAARRSSRRSLEWARSDDLWLKVRDRIRSLRVEYSALTAVAN